MSRKPSDIGFVIVTLLVTITLVYIYATYQGTTPESLGNEIVSTKQTPRIVTPSRSQERVDINVPPKNLPEPKPTFTPKPKPEVTEEPVTVVTKPVTKPKTSNNLPYGLQLVRSCESGPWRDGGCGYDLSLYNYNAINSTGCEGQGCYGAYQMHASYMSAWAVEAGYSKYAYVGIWPPEVQDAVALYKWNASNGRLWCDWASYC